MQLSNQKPVQGLLLTFHCCATMLCCALLFVTCCLSPIEMFVFYHVYCTSVPFILLNFISPFIYFATPDVCFSCVCQLFNKECMMMMMMTSFYFLCFFVIVCNALVTLLAELMNLCTYRRREQ